MLRTMRVILAALLLVQVASACTEGNGSETPSGVDTRARLDALGERWMTTPATIIYRTTQRKPGEATSPHQCLRQMVGDAVGGQSGIQSGLRICSGMGELRLAWDPPDRWRIDQAAPGNRLTLLSTPGGSVRCHVVHLPSPRCVNAESDGPFGSLIDPPGMTIDQIRSVVATSSQRMIAGIRSDCFAVEGGPAGAIHTMEWCYSPEGLLLFLNDTVEGGRVVTAEATEVSRQVSDEDFVLAPT
jgi:hypothetical protein